MLGIGNHDKKKMNIKMTCKFILLPQVLLVCEPELDHKVSKIYAWHSGDSISSADYAFEAAEPQDIFWI